MATTATPLRRRQSQRQFSGAAFGEGSARGARLVPAPSLSLLSWAKPGARPGLGTAAGADAIAWGETGSASSSFKIADSRGLIYLVYSVVLSLGMQRLCLVLEPNEAERHRSAVVPLERLHPTTLGKRLFFSCKISSVWILRAQTVSLAPRTGAVGILPGQGEAPLPVLRLVPGLSGAHR